ncbi:galactose ABC transporter substrate-binding protein [Thermoguttaceae bacterium LCP21S3_D4]|nr:galactose ABC transporter substrate-binding protein [Lachnospiraceae bacterium]HCJ75786.1 galactose ABC transporter substrate-binding protein [Roseburia sp.]
MSRTIERITAVIVALMVSALMLSGCSQKIKQTENTLRVSVVTYTHDDPFINAMVDELKEELKTWETEDRKIITSVRSADNDQKAQNEIVEEMIDAGCDILCVNLVDRTDPTTVIRLARQNDIPVIFFNREPVPEDLAQWNQLYYVGCEAKQSGEMQGEIAADYIKNHPEIDRNQDGRIQYVLLEGEAGHQDAISRTDSSVKTLIEQGINLEKLSYQFADWNRGQAENRMNQIINQYGAEVEMILSNNDEMALGAIEAYKNAGYSQQEWPIIFGIDGLDDALEAIQNGTMQGTVYNDKEDQAGEIARLAVDIYDGKNQEIQNLQEEKYYVSQYRKVDTSNVEDFLKQ